MTLQQLEKRRKSAIMKKWLELVYETYPPDTASFLKEEVDRFANPVGYVIASNLRKILDGLIEGSDMQAMSSYLEDIIKIRAVQDFSPSQAVCFIDLLKKVILSEIPAETEADATGLVSRIDRLAFMSADIYARTKEKIAQLKERERIKNHVIAGQAWQSPGREIASSQAPRNDMTDGGSLQ
jgi:hypothetical protein